MSFRNENALAIALAKHGIVMNKIRGSAAAADEPESQLSAAAASAAAIPDIDILAIAAAPINEEARRERAMAKIYQEAASLRDIAPEPPIGSAASIIRNHPSGNGEYLYFKQMKKEGLKIDYSLPRPETSFTHIMTEIYDDAMAERLEAIAAFSQAKEEEEQFEFDSTSLNYGAGTSRDFGKPARVIPFRCEHHLREDSMSDLPLMKSDPGYSQPSYQFNEDYVRSLAIQRCDEHSNFPSSDSDDEEAKKITGKFLRKKVILTGEEADKLAKEKTRNLYAHIQARCKKDRDGMKEEELFRKTQAKKDMMRCRDNTEIVFNDDGKPEIMDYNFRRRNIGGPILRYTLDSGYKTPPVSPSSSDDSSRQNSGEEDEAYIDRMDVILKRRIARANKRFHRRTVNHIARTEAKMSMINENNEKNQFLVDQYFLQQRSSEI